MVDIGKISNQDHTVIKVSNNMEGVRYHWLEVWERMRLCVRWAMYMGGGKQSRELAHLIVFFFSEPFSLG